MEELEPMNSLPETCHACSARPCEKEPVGTLDLCPYGVLFEITEAGVRRKETSSPIRHIAGNLRHEIHPVLGYMVSQISEIEPRLSARHIDTASPMGRLLAAVTILDDTVQMITGVHDFHPLPVSPTTPVAHDLCDMVRRRFKMYSLLGGRNRSRGLRLTVDAEQDYRVSKGAHMIEYIVSVLMDNVWKFAQEESRVEVKVEDTGATAVNMSVANVSQYLPEQLDLFEMGSKGHADKKGFGYGLYWAQILVDRYNGSVGESPVPLALYHDQIDVANGVARHEFILKGVAVDRRRS